MGSNTDEFFSAVVRRLGGAPNAGVLALLNTWASFEGTSARFNPLATTQRWGLSSSFNSAGVQNFADENDGVCATAATLSNGYYPTVHALLVAGNGDPAAWRNPAVEAEVNKWGTHGFANYLRSGGSVGDGFTSPAIPAGSVDNTAVNTGSVPPPHVPVADTRTYVVVAGDSLWALAQRFYGDGSKYGLIAQASGVTNPNLLHIGQVLTIPALPGTASSVAASQSDAAARMGAAVKAVSDIYWHMLDRAPDQSGDEFYVELYLINGGGTTGDKAVRMSIAGSDEYIAKHPGVAWNA